MNINNKYCTIDELGKIARGKSKHRPRNAPELYGGKYPFIQTGDVKHAGLYINSYTQTYNEKGLAQSKLWNTGVLCITIAANIADTAILKIQACFPDSIIGFIPFPNKSDVRYVKYCLDSFKLQIQAISQGTTQDNLSLEKLKTIRLKKFSYTIQRKIAAILSAYDDLIENNNRRIAILEKMAEEIYREWFVRMRFPGHEKVKFHKGVPEGWESSKVNKIGKEIRKSIKARNLEKQMKYIGLEHLSRRSIFIKEYDYSSSVYSDKLLFQNGDILFGKIRPYLHKIAYAHFDGACSSDTIVIRPLSVEYAGFILFIIFSDTFVELANCSSKGTKMPRADWDFLKNLEILVPKKEILLHFQEQFDSIHQMVCRLLFSNEKIFCSRNLLFSRLITGKLSIEDLNIHFPPSMVDSELVEDKEANA